MNFKVCFQEQLSHLNLKNIKSVFPTKVQALDFLDKKVYIICQIWLKPGNSTGKIQKTFLKLGICP